MEILDKFYLFSHLAAYLLNFHSDNNITEFHCFKIKYLPFMNAAPLPMANNTIYKLLVRKQVIADCELNKIWLYVLTFIFLDKSI